MKPKKAKMSVNNTVVGRLYWLKSENKRHNSCFSNVDKLHKHETHQNRAKKAKFRGLRSVYSQNPEEEKCENCLR